MKSLNQIANESLSVCDGCSNWRICKFSEDVKRAEAEYKQLRENADWPECVETTLGCKYKQYATSGYITSANRQIKEEPWTTTATYV